MPETVDSRRRIIEQTNGSVSDSEFCEIPTGGMLIKKIKNCAVAAISMRATYPLKKHRCVEQYRLADEARRYAKPFQAAVMNEA